MTLITRRDLKTVPLHPTEVSSGLEPSRPGVGSVRFDAVLLAPPAPRPSADTPRRRDRIRAIAELVRGTGLRSAVVSVPANTRAEPDLELYRHVGDARGILVITEEGYPVSGVWLWWLLGHARALGQRIAVFPVARRNPWRRLWTLPPGLRQLPYVGSAKAVGDTDPSFWVIPAGHPPESREALNMDYWLHRYRSGNDYGFH